MVIVVFSCEMEPQKPFACTLPDCGMSFTNEDHLNVHTKKHDMILQLGMEQKAAFVADQTPTPTRFIRNCEEVGLFQDLQSVNPFDEGFKQAMLDKKQGLLSVESDPASEDVLHTPHLVFPLEPGDCAQYTANNKHNITISRSSSDETGAVKEYETTTISKLTNKVTTISRVVGKQDIVDRVTDDVSIVRHKNNVIKIHSNVEIIKDGIIDTTKDIKTSKFVKKDIPPIMSQQSIDLVVDSLTVDGNTNKSSKNFKRKVENEEGKSTDMEDDLEVIIKLPSGKNIRMKAVDENEKNVKINAKERLKNVIASKNKIVTSTNTGIQIPITSGTLIPVTFVNPKVIKRLPSIPIEPLEVKPKDKGVENTRKEVKTVVINTLPKMPIPQLKVKSNPKENSKMSRSDLESRSAASKRYRERFKEKMHRQEEENRHLKEKNRRLAAEKAALQLILTQHMKSCPMADDLRNFENKILEGEKYLNEI